VTTDTWKSLADHCEGVPQGNVDIKGKGSMDLYRVERLKVAS
jgi:hypothetical protein